jgi:hypothetical protein
MNEDSFRKYYLKSTSVIFRHHSHFIAVLASFLTFGSVGVASESLIDLGGPRKATARILTDEKVKTCEISFLGVQAFDPATNDLLNQSKSKFLAIQAFAKDHKIPSGSKFSCSVRRTAPIKSEGDRVKTTYLLDSIDLLRRGDAEEREKTPESRPQKSTDDQNRGREHSGQGGTATSLLTAMSEMAGTLTDLVTSLHERIDAIQNDSGSEALDHEVAELESSIEETIQDFDAMVSSERMLLGSEQDQLKASSQEEAKKLMSALAARYAMLGKETPSQPTPKP